MPKGQGRRLCLFAAMLQPGIFPASLEYVLRCLSAGRRQPYHGRHPLRGAVTKPPAHIVNCSRLRSAEPADRMETLAGEGAVVQTASHASHRHDCQLQ
jgi:hypothetical protein